MRLLKVFFGDSNKSTPTGCRRVGLQTGCNRMIIVSFFWGKTERRDAEIIAVRAYSFIRFRWLDNEKPREYFELKMIKIVERTN